MDDQPLVRVLHGRAYRQEQLQTFSDRKLAGIAIAVDGLAFDQFHDEVGKPAFGGAAIEQARDVGMIEAGQYLPFVLEAVDELGALPGAYQLDRNLFAELIVGAERAIDLAHATAADLLDDLIGSDALANPCGRGVASRGSGRVRLGRSRQQRTPPRRCPSGHEATPGWGESQRIPRGLRIDKRRDNADDSLCACGWSY